MATPDGKKPKEEEEEFTIAHYVYTQANTYSIFLNCAQCVLVYIRRSNIVALLFGFL